MHPQRSARLLWRSRVHPNFVAAEAGGVALAALHVMTMMDCETRERVRTILATGRHGSMSSACCKS